VISAVRRGDFRKKLVRPTSRAPRQICSNCCAGALKTTEIRLGTRCVAVETGKNGSAAAPLPTAARSSRHRGRATAFIRGANACSRRPPRFTGCHLLGAWRRPMRCARHQYGDRHHVGWARHGHVVHYPRARRQAGHIVAHSRQRRVLVVPGPGNGNVSWDFRAGMMRRDEVMAAYAVGWQLLALRRNV